MKEKILNRMVVRDARAAAVFTDPRMRRLLLWFVRRSRSVGEAATAWEMDPKRAHYYVRRLVGLGLLLVVEQRARAGRPIKYYRAASNSFFIPSDAAPKGFGEELARELREGLAQEFGRGDGGMLFTAARNGSPRGRMVRGSAAPPRAVELWRVLRMRPRDMAALTREINALFNRYQRDMPAGGDIYLVHAALALRGEGDGVADNQP